MKASLGVLLWLGAPLCALEGVPERWEQVLDEVLQRAEKSKEGSFTWTQGPRSDVEPRNSAGTQLLEPIVKNFVRYFQGAGLRHYSASVRRLQVYRPMISRILTEEGLPPELMWIGLVESGYDAAVRSPKNAVGMWQLIPETAKRFGLRVGQSDDRTDPEKSTRAAARYLKVLYGRFGDWRLVLAAYNAGESRVQNAIEQAKERDFWRLSATGLLPHETQAYVPAVLAAQFLGGGNVEDSRPTLDSETRRTVVFAPFTLSQ